jgi:hypothetical protein
MRVRRPDPALAALLGCVALLGFASAVATPIETTLDIGRDEGAHLAYVQSLAERGEAPAEDVPGPHLTEFSSEQRTARRFAGGATVTRDLHRGPIWTAATEARWRAAASRLTPASRRDGGGPNPLGYMPPGYYAALVPVYEATPGSWLDRALALRLTSTLLLAMATALAWRLALVLGLARIAALACAAVVGLNPHAIQLAGVVNPDAAVLPLWIGVLIAGVRLLQGDRLLRPLLALVVLLAALLAVKPTALALLPAVAFAGVVAAGRRRPLLLAGATLLTGALAVAVSRRLERPLVGGHEDLAELPGYLAQFYTPFAAPFPDQTGWISTNVVAVDRSVAGSLAPAVVGALFLAAAAWFVVRGPMPSRAIATFLALGALGLLAAVHWTEFKSLTEGRGPFTSPRYLLPLTPLAGLVLGAAAARLPPRWAAPAVGTVAALCAGSSAAWVLERAELGFA